MKPAIFVTGGHITPAIAVIEEIERRKLPWRVIFIGRKKALEGSTNVSVEYQEMKSRGIQFHSLVTGRVSRVLTPWAVWSVLKIPIGFVQAIYYVLRHHPALVLSFGGYVAVPVAIAARLCGVPVVTHEQTRAMGLSNRLITHLATAVLLSYPSGRIQAGNAYYTGLPIRKELYHPPEDPSFPLPEEKPMLYITGGSTGAATLNDALFPTIETLLHDWTIIHQTGTASYDKALAYKAMLPKIVKDRYIVLPYFSVTDVAWILHHATIVIGRSGANTVGELATMGKVSILIPLPWSGANEQFENARWLESQGTAIVIPQEHVNTKRIIAAISKVTVGLKTYYRAAQILQKSLQNNASSRVVDILAQTIAS